MSHKAIKVGLTVFVLVGAFTTLLFTTLQDNLQYYKYVDEVVATSHEWQGKNLQVHGYVVPGSIAWKPNTLEYRFDLLKVRSHSIKGFNYYYGVQLDAFGDAGTAWNTNEEFTRNFIAGGGFGIRVIVPYVNVIRIEFGFGEANQGMISHFGIMDKAVYERRRVR